MIYDGKKIKALREAMNNGEGWSMGELARRSGIKQPSLRALEHQITKKPKAETLMSIARALGVPLREILSAKAGKSSYVAHDQLVALFDSLDDQNKGALVATAQALLNSQKPR